jgi:D-sedoheptulose 7-phosphate isomerase
VSPSGTPGLGPSLDLAQYFDSYIATLRRIDQAAVRQMSQLVYGAWVGRHTVFLCGNGGNAANAAHIATDLVKLTAPAHGPRLRAVALGESLSGLTAVGNDIAFDQIFSEQLRAFLSPHDIVIGLSTSGSSPNVLRAVEYANESGAVTMGITGLGGQKLQSCARLPIVVASSSVQQIEDATMLVGHLVCLLVRDLIAASVGARRDETKYVTAPVAAAAWAAVPARARLRSSPVRPPASQCDPGRP